MGDPAGIGPDIVLTAWTRRKRLKLPPFLVVGDPDLFGARARLLGLDVPVVAVDAPAEAVARHAHALPMLPVYVGRDVHPGRPDEAAAPAVIAAIERSVELLRTGECAAIVTAPISKSVLYGAGFRHPGHTEFLADLARAWGDPAPHPVMMLACAELKVVPVTIHLPLKEVPGLLTERLIVTTVETTVRALRTDFGIAAPRIAVCGLNPHAGEAGTLGTEETDIVVPAIERLRAQGLNVTGPHPADTIFHAAARATYDAAVAMYHDQALIPVKTLAFERAVNVTLGLPFVRTSPDHGTAYDLAGSGRADSQSLIESIRLAHDIALRRRLAA